MAMSSAIGLRPFSQCRNGTSAPSRHDRAQGDSSATAYGVSPARRRCRWSWRRAHLARTPIGTTDGLRKCEGKIKGAARLASRTQCLRGLGAARQDFEPCRGSAYALAAATRSAILCARVEKTA